MTIPGDPEYRDSHYRTQAVVGMQRFMARVMGFYFPWRVSNAPEDLVRRRSHEDVVLVSAAGDFITVVPADLASSVILLPRYEEGSGPIGSDDRIFDVLARCVCRSYDPRDWNIRPHGPCDPDLVRIGYEAGPYVVTGLDDEVGHEVVLLSFTARAMAERFCRDGRLTRTTPPLG